MKFPETIVYYRKRLGMTQFDLAMRLGIGRSSMGMYETGQREPSIELLEKMASVLGISVSALLGETPVPANPEDDGEFPEIAMIGRASKRMSPERRQDMLKMLKIAFPDAFREDGNEK